MLNFFISLRTYSQDTNKSGVLVWYLENWDLMPSVTP